MDGFTLLFIVISLIIGGCGVALMWEEANREQRDRERLSELRFRQWARRMQQEHGKNAE